MAEIRIRNSMLSDWKELCRLAFRARWFGNPEERAAMDIGDLEAIRWGSYFEQLTLGSGVGGKMIEMTDKEIKSEYYKRTKRQAEVARKFIFTQIGVPFLAAQVEMHADFVIEGVTVKTTGNADAQLGHKHPEIILDTKFTADTTNTFGKYAWGAPEKVDMGQLVMYTEQSLVMYGHKPRPMYYVADRTPKERVEVLEPEFSNYYIQEYMWLLKETFVEINQAVNFNYWPHIASYNNCKQCPLKNLCPSAVTIPEIKKIQK